MRPGSSTFIGGGIVFGSLLLVAGTLAACARVQETGPLFADPDQREGGDGGAGPPGERRAGQGPGGGAPAGGAAGGDGSGAIGGQGGGGVAAERGAGRPFPSRVASVAFEVRVSPPGPADIAGFVRDRDGNPVARACVELAAAGRARAPMFTPAEGSFRFSDVPAGLVRVTMTVAGLEVADRKRIADYHNQDPNLTVMLRPLVIAPPGARFEVLRVKREGDYGQGDGTRWIEVAPLALALEGYSAACRQALDPPPRRRQR